MKILIAMFLSLTNLQSGAPFGDPLTSLNYNIYERFKYYAIVNGNFAIVPEYRYQYVYDTYNSTVGRQITYDNKSFYILNPDVEIGFSYWIFKTVLSYKGFSDGNYRYEKVIYSSGYVPEDTIKIQRTGETYTTGIRVIAGFGNFLGGIGGVLFNRLDTTGTKRGLSPLLILGYSMKTFKIAAEISPKTRFPHEAGYAVPNDLVVYASYIPLIKSISSVETVFRYSQYSKIDNSYSDYLLLRTSVIYGFRDQTFLRMGGVLEKTYIGGYYIPGVVVGLGYALSPLNLGINLEKTFYNYTLNSEIVEESPLKVGVYLKFSK
ncbi:MAG: hypothetical protein ACPLN0_06595 [Candidatus Hydrothermia bacterium]